MFCAGVLIYLHYNTQDSYYCSWLMFVASDLMQLCKTTNRSDSEQGNKEVG